MANITLLGASYTDVPAVTLPQTGGGTVTFYENGGSSPWTLITSTTLAVSTTSTSAATAGTIQCGTGIVTKDKIVWVHIRDTAVHSIH